MGLLLTLKQHIINVFTIPNSKHKNLRLYYSVWTKNRWAFLLNKIGCFDGHFERLELDLVKMSSTYELFPLRTMISFRILRSLSGHVLLTGSIPRMGVMMPTTTQAVSLLEGTSSIPSWQREHFAWSPGRMMSRVVVLVSRVHSEQHQQVYGLNHNSILFSFNVLDKHIEAFTHGNTCRNCSYRMGPIFRATLWPN